MLLIAKSVAVGLSSSIAIISSLVDSAVDLLSGIIIWWTSRAMKKKNIYTYPEGMVNVLKFQTPNFLTKWHMQTVQTQIRQLLSDQGRHCLPFHQVFKKKNYIKSKI